MKTIYLVVALFLLSLSNVYAEPSKFVFDESVKPRSSEKYIKAVHEEMYTSTDNIDTIRYQILQGMLNTRGYKWLYDGEGDGFILARFTYRGDTNIIRIEYNKSMVQLKYHDALGDFVCKKNVGDICYKNARGYYNYIKNLRKSINAQLKQGS